MPGINILSCSPPAHRERFFRFLVPSSSCAPKQNQQFTKNQNGKISKSYRLLGSHWGRSPWGLSTTRNSSSPRSWPAYQRSVSRHLAPAGSFLCAFPDFCFYLYLFFRGPDRDRGLYRDVGPDPGFSSCLSCPCRGRDPYLYPVDRDLCSCLGAWKNPSRGVASGCFWAKLVRD